MCEITARNFNTILPELKKALNNARFITVDLEFSCLTASQRLENSLFDTANERYSKLRTTVEQMIPVQIGLSAFTFDPNSNSYNSDVYTFYIFPRSFVFLDKKFVCQSTSLQFLATHQFDFNKFVREGISYITSTQEEELLRYFKNDSSSSLDSSMLLLIENLLEEKGEVISKWISKAKIDDILTFDDIKTHETNLDVRYFLHKDLRRRFCHIWTYEDEEGFKVQKTTKENYDKLEKNNNLEQAFLSDLIGFTKVFRLLTALKKPLIGHNLLLDLMIMIHHFEKPLPKSYSAFKTLVHSLFPAVYDTKCLSFNVKSFIPENKYWQRNTLEELYYYFKDKSGRHLVLDSPLIEPPPTVQQQVFHCAGWDSFCTGYIFIRMAHVCAANTYKVKSKKFMSSELIQAVSHLKNSVNIIRGDISHIQLDGNDPISRRPPWLIVTGIHNKPLNIPQVTSLLSNYGFVEIKPHSSKRNRIIVAVDNFGSARRILAQFKSHSDFKIQQYSVFKHSLFAGAVLWSGLMASTAVLAWYSISKLK